MRWVSYSLVFFEFEHWKKLIDSIISSRLRDSGDILEGGSMIGFSGMKLVESIDLAFQGVLILFIHVDCLVYCTQKKYIYSEYIFEANHSSPS